MAFDWIKLRPALFTSPKVTSMAKILSSDRDFIEWAMDGEKSASDGLSEPASRFVTVSALASLWSCARAHGKYVENDLVLTDTTPECLDSMAGVPSFHKAMVSVGWAIYDDASKCVTLPNFRDYNSESRTDAERSKAYRERQKTARHGASRRVTKRHAPSRPREERRGEENNTPLTPLAGGNGRVPKKQQEAEAIYQAYPKKVGRRVAVTAIERALDRIRKRNEPPEDPAAWLKGQVAAYSGCVASWPAERLQYVPNPATWFNQDRFDDDQSGWKHETPEQSQTIERF